MTAQPNETNMATMATESEMAKIKEENTRRPTVKILVAYHRPAFHIMSDIYVPIHVGRAVMKKRNKDGVLSEEDRQWMLANTIGDDEGENISALNPYYCEMTGYYWAWKNYEKLGDPDFIGLMHYHRTFGFSSGKKENYSLPRLTDQVVKEHMNIEAFREKLKSCDLVLNPTQETETTVDAQGNTIEYTAREWWNKCHGSYYSDEALDYIKKNYHDYYQTALRYLDQSQEYRCNMAIFKKELFFEYCEFIFGILENIYTDKEMFSLSIDRARSIGTLAERLSGIFFAKKIEEERWRIEYVPRIFFAHHYEPKELHPAFKDHNIPVFFAANNSYAHACGIAIQSLKEHAGNKKNYDIVILYGEGRLSKTHQRDLLRLVEGCTNISLRFYEMSSLMEDKEFYMRTYYTREAYYKCFAPQIFRHYDKIIYLDADVLIREDIAPLYDLYTGGGYWLAAVRDYDTCARFRKVNYWEGAKLPNELGIEDMFTEYFNAGVLVLNLKELRQHHVQDAWLEVALSHKYEKMVQDVLNKVCYGHVQFIPSAWNVIHNAGERRGYMKRIPAAYYSEWMEDRDRPKIIHYVSADKPWKKPDVDFADLWWECARRTLPSYCEGIIYKFQRDALAQELKKARAQVHNLEKNLKSSTAKIDKKLLMRDATHLGSIKRRYWYNRILSHLTFGEVHERYKSKKKSLYERIKKVQKYVNHEKR